MTTRTQWAWTVRRRRKLGAKRWVVCLQSIRFLVHLWQKAAPSLPCDTSPAQRWIMTRWLVRLYNTCFRSDYCRFANRQTRQERKWIQFKSTVSHVDWMSLMQQLVDSNVSEQFKAFQLEHTWEARRYCTFLISYRFFAASQRYSTRVVQRNFNYRVAVLLAF